MSATLTNRRVHPPVDMPAAQTYWTDGEPQTDADHHFAVCRGTHSTVAGGVFNHVADIPALPAIHDGGTPRRELLAVNIAAAESILTAAEALKRAEPKACDYLAEGAYCKALREHQTRLRALSDLHREYMRIVRHVHG